MSPHPVQRLALSVALLLLIPTIALAFPRSSNHVPEAEWRDGVSGTSALAAEVPHLAPPPSIAQEALAQLESTRKPPAPAEAEALPQEEPTEEATQEPTPEPEPTEDDPELFITPPRTLFLSIGHGRTPAGRLDTGSIHPKTGQREIDAAAVVVQAMTEVLQQAPNLHLWAQAGDHPNVVGTVRAANHRRADDCIEIHQDWHRAPPGAFAHWHPSSSGAKQLADRLVVSLREEGIPTRNKWHKARPGLWFLRATSCRAVLVEVGRVGDFDNEQLAGYGRALAHAYLDDLRSRP